MVVLKPFYHEVCVEVCFSLRYLPGTFLGGVKLLIGIVSSLHLFLYGVLYMVCLLYTSPSPRDKRQSRMPSSA